MNQGDALQTIAEIAITLGGFTGLVAAFRGKSAHTWTSAEIYRLRFLIGLSFVILICAILPFAIGGWTESAQLIWGIPSLLYGLTVLTLLYTTVHRWMTGTFTPTFRHFVAVNIALGIAIHILIVFSAFNFVLDASASMMIVGMIWSFTHGATIFLAMLSILWEES
jgi:hypothetical protein